MTDRTAAEAWVAAYRTAWESNDEFDIRALFTEDAVYRADPASSPPARGIAEILDGWKENADEPGSTRFEYAVLAVDGDLAVIRCISTYTDYDPPRVYDNLFVVRLAEDGRAHEFTDWWIERDADAPPVE
jgi:ketosteroid isomerase-like protein